MKITDEEVRRVAELAALALRDDEVEKLAKDLDNILSHMDKLSPQLSDQWKAIAGRTPQQ